MAFNQRVDARGNPVTAALRYLIHYPAGADGVDQIRQSTFVPEGAPSIAAVNVARSGWTPIEDPHAPPVVAPILPWFALADWKESGIIAFVLARRQGMPAPLLLRKKSDIESITSILGGGGAVPPVMGDFASSNVVVKVWDEWGTFIDGTEGNMFDSNGSYYSSGTVA